MKGNRPITSVRLNNPLETGINYSMSYLEMEACIAAHMDVEKWTNPNPPPEGYPRKLKAQVIAFHLLQQQVKAHTEDAAIEHSKKEADKQRRKGARRPMKRRRR